MEKTKENPGLLDMAAPEKEKKQVIAQGLTVEEIRALFFDKDALEEPPYRVYQLNSDGHRYYYRFGKNGEPEFYPSVTTLLKQVMPMSPILLDWMLQNGKDGSVEKRDLAAAYGTFMHMQFEKLAIARCYDFEKVPDELLAYMQENNLPEKFFADSISKIRKDVLSFAQFMRDYKVRPLAVEIGLVHPKKKYAGCIDMPCEMTDPKTGDTFRAIVDFKSGRKGFFEEHELQLHLYKDMWNVNIPEKPIERVFNFSPKDWRTKPTYNLKEQTDSVNAKKIPHLLALAGIEDDKRENTVTFISGFLDLDRGKLSDNISTLSLAELIKKIHKKDEAPKSKSATKAEVKSADTTHAVYKEEPEVTKNGDKVAEKATKDTEPIENTPEPGKAVKTGNNDKFPWEKEDSAKQVEKENLLNFEMEL